MRYLYLLTLVCLGALGSLLGWAAAQLLALGSLEVLEPPVKTVSVIHFFWEGALLGAGLGWGLQIREAFFQGSDSVSLLEQSKTGALHGVLVGLSAVLLSLTVVDWLPDPQWGGLLYVVVLGGGLGFLTSQSADIHTQVFQMIGGLFGGGFSYFLLSTLQSVHLVQGFSSWIPLLLIGLCISLLLGLPETFFTKSRLRLLTGDRAGHVFWLHPFSNSLGYDSHNSLILHHYREVRSRHARMVRRQKQFVLENLGEPQEVMVNYRPVTSQPLQSGDLIRIGTALLQYSE
jgi:hypothetical protein